MRPSGAKYTLKQRCSAEEESKAKEKGGMKGKDAATSKIDGN